MPIVRIAILEDNPIDSLTLQMMLAEPLVEVCQFQVVQAFDKLTPLLEFLDSNDVDIIIADIFMNNKAAGLQLAEHLKHRPIPILFISNTQDKEVFLDIQRKSSSRFISKPISAFTLLSRLTSIFDEIQHSRHYYFSEKKYLYLSGRGGQQEQVLFDDILYVSSEGNYCFIFTSVKKYALKTSLSKLIENDLKDNFIRIHKKFIINKAAVKVVTHSSIKINEQISLPLGRSYRKALVDFTKKYY